VESGKTFLSYCKHFSEIWKNYFFLTAGFVFRPLFNGFRLPVFDERTPAFSIISGIGRALFDLPARPDFGGRKTKNENRAPDFHIFAIFRLASYHNFSLK